ICGLKWKSVCLGLLLITAAGLGMGMPLLPTPAPVPETPTARTTPAPPEQTKHKPRRDRYGDPLPPGAIARLGTLRFRVDAIRVNQMAFAPDGKTLALVTPSGLTLFDTASGKQMKNISPLHTSFERLAYSPDGKRLMTYTFVQARSLPGKM